MRVRVWSGDVGVVRWCDEVDEVYIEEDSHGYLYPWSQDHWNIKKGRGER
jgi:hypothetical protein